MGFTGAVVITLLKSLMLRAKEKEQPETKITLFVPAR